MKIQIQQRQPGRYRCYPGPNAAKRRFIIITAIMTSTLSESNYLNRGHLGRLRCARPPQFDSSNLSLLETNIGKNIYQWRRPNYYSIQSQHPVFPFLIIPYMFMPKHNGTWLQRTERLLCEQRELSKSSTRARQRIRVLLLRFNRFQFFHLQSIKPKQRYRLPSEPSQRVASVGSMTKPHSTSAAHAKPMMLSSSTSQNLPSTTSPS